MTTGGSDMDIYNFEDSGIGDSWMIGTGDLTDAEWNYGNAYKTGYRICPYHLKVPYTLDRYGTKKPVEVIGPFAFCACSYHGYTRKITLTKQVKVIKRLGFGLLDDLEDFVLEDGSALEKIEERGLWRVGLNLYYMNMSHLRTTITLPSSLSSVAGQGICECNQFYEIVYCGSNPLTNVCNLELRAPNKTVVKVLPQYPLDKKIFGQDPDRSSENEIGERCMKMDNSNFIAEPFEDGCMVIGWGVGTSLWCPYTMEIPEKINGSTVLAIKEHAFEKCETESPIFLPSTVKKIGSYAFANTTGATSIVCDSKELEIGEAAFQGCGTKADQPINVTLHRNTKLSKKIFAGAKLGGVYVT